MKAYLIAAAAVVPFLASGCGWAAQVQTVGNPAQLKMALLTAKGGSEIRLKAGNYGDLDLGNRTFTGGRLKLVALEPGKPVFTSVNLNKASGIILAGLRFSGPGRPVITIMNASDVVLVGNHISGITNNRDPWDETGTGIRLRFSRNITIANNRFSDLKGTAFLQGSDGVIFSNNEISHVREGINVASTRNLYIERNFFHSFSPKFQDNEHPDSIQFWTARETEGSQNVRLAENVMLHGLCGAVQGIFIRSERREVRHRNFTLERNVYYGASKHGVSVSDVDSAIIRNNVVVGSPYSESGARRDTVTDPRCGGALSPAILARGSTQVEAARNIAPLIGKLDGREIDNIIVGPKGVPYEQVFGARPTGDTPPLSAFISKPGSKAAKKAAGLAAKFSYGPANDLPTAILSALRLHGEL